jgi:hypothetical protein
MLIAWYSGSAAMTSLRRCPGEVALRLKGSVLPIIYPLRVVTARNPVATIGPGVTGCPASGA